jgi:hypothetical protein
MWGEGVPGHGGKSWQKVFQWFYCHKNKEILPHGEASARAPIISFFPGVLFEGAGPWRGWGQLGAMQGPQAGNYLFAFPKGQTEVKVAEH